MAVNVDFSESDSECLPGSYEFDSHSDTDPVMKLTMEKLKWENRHNKICVLVGNILEGYGRKRNRC